MKQIAILGSAGEIGEKILNILKNDFNIKAGYHKKHLNRMNNRVTYYHVDIMEYESLRQFVSGSDYVINCAGSSYMNGIYVAKACAEENAIYIDPFGDNFLESQIKADRLDGIFILSCGCFPGMTGILIRHLCNNLDKINFIEGFTFDNQTPGIYGIVDFILSGINGFGESDYYYNREKIKDTKIKIIKNNENQDICFQKYYTAEMKRIIKRYSPREAVWYSPLLSADIKELMQKAIIEYLRHKNYYIVVDYAKKIQEMILEKYSNEKKYCEITIKCSGEEKGEIVNNSIKLINPFGSNISAVVIASIIYILDKNSMAKGVYYADDIVEFSEIKTHMNSYFELYVNDKLLDLGGISYDEGSI
ncbi:TPA: saccharopine dehydrogenase NADP-binding domain-containing protein [Streptococcus agalactiae]